MGAFQADVCSVLSTKRSDIQPVSSPPFRGRTNRQSSEQPAPNLEAQIDGLRGAISQCGGQSMPRGESWSSSDPARIHCSAILDDDTSDWRESPLMIYTQVVG